MAESTQPILRQKEKLPFVLKAYVHYEYTKQLKRKVNARLHTQCFCPKPQGCTRRACLIRHQWGILADAASQRLTHEWRSLQFFPQLLYNTPTCLCLRIHTDSASLKHPAWQSGDKQAHTEPPTQTAHMHAQGLRCETFTASRYLDSVCGLKL